MFYHAELISVTASVLLLVVSVFAWQAATQSTGAYLCGRTDALLLTSARMDWHGVVLTVVDLFIYFFQIVIPAEAKSKIWVSFELC